MLRSVTQAFPDDVPWPLYPPVLALRDNIAGSARASAVCPVSVVPCDDTAVRVVPGITGDFPLLTPPCCRDGGRGVNGLELPLDHVTRGPQSESATSMMYRP